MQNSIQYPAPKSRVCSNQPEDSNQEKLIAFESALQFEDRIGLLIPTIALISRFQPINLTPEKLSLILATAIYDRPNFMGLSSLYFLISR